MIVIAATSALKMCSPDAYRGSATYYVPAGRLGLGDAHQPTDGSDSVLPGNFRDLLPGNPRGLSTKSGGLSSNPLALSSKSDGLSSNPQAAEQEAARTALLDTLPGSLAARLGAIGQRHPPQDIQDLVLALCALRDWPVTELALVLRRNAEVVRQNYLRPLMRDGRLVMTRPEEPNDPWQAYRAASGVHGDVEPDGPPDL